MKLKYVADLHSRLHGMTQQTNNLDIVNICIILYLIDFCVKNALILKCYFLRKAHSTEETPFTIYQRMYVFGTFFVDKCNGVLLLVVDA